MNGNICGRMTVRGVTIAAVAGWLLQGAAGVAPHNPYGTTSHLTRTGYAAREGLCAKFSGAGGRWMRMDFDWRALERRPGNWDFSRYDDILSAAESNGVQVVGILTAPPEWCRPVWEHLDGWRGFVRKVAVRYRGRIPVYEIWNEEDAESFWGYKPDATNYTALLKASYETLKVVDPSIRVALGSLTGSHGLPFGERLYAAGAAPWFDIMNVHPYPTYGRPSRPTPEGWLDVWLEKLKGIMARYGDAGKEIWITEIGWPAPHEVRFSAPGVLRAGLRAIEPGRKTWRALVVDRVFGPYGCGEGMLDMVRGELPDGSAVTGCGFESFESKLAAERPDLVVITPRSQLYPSASGKALIDFARAGGVIAEFGGMPFYKGPDGVKETPASWQLRRALHFDAQCWWVKDLPAVPKKIQVRPTAAAADVICPERGFEGQRFVSDRFLGPGDTFTPLLKATWTNGVDCVAAAAIRYAGGGGIVVDGLFGSVAGVYSEREQATYLPRAYLIAFASGVSTVMWYELRSHDFDRHDEGWGMLHLDLSEKQSWTAFRTLVAQRPAGSVALSVPSPDADVWHVAWRRPDGCRAGALWTEAAAKEVTVDLGEGTFTFADYMGRPVVPGKADGRWRLKVSGEVVYYRRESDGDSAAERESPIPVYGSYALADAECARLRRELPPRIETARTRCADWRRRLNETFGAASDALRPTRIRARLEIVERLCDFAARETARGDVTGLASAERAAYDLDAFDRYFRDEFDLWARFPRGDASEPPKVFDLVGDFGARGDGRTDTAAAFARAQEAIRACGGKPTVLRIPAGDYLFAGRQVVPEFTCSFSGERCRDANVRHAQVPVFALENCLIEGSAPGKVRFRLGDFASQGLRLVNCRNVTVRNVELAYVKCPFLQGRILAVDPAAATCDVAVTPGTLTPDDPAFVTKGASDGMLCCSSFTPAGDLVRPASFMFYARRFEDLGNGNWRLWFDASQPSYQHGRLKPGDGFVLPARNNFYHAASMAYSDFCDFESVWVRNSRAAAFSVHRSRQSSFDRCRLFPEEGRLLSANADGLINSVGTCMLRCAFRNQSDDGFNSMARGEFVNGVADGDALLHARVGRGVADELLVLVDPATGQYRGNLFARDGGQSVAWRQGGCWRTPVTRRVPADVKSYDSLGLALISRERQGRAAMNLERLASEPDHVYAPSADGVGTLVLGCDIRNMRGCGVVVQGSNALVADNAFSNIWMAVRLGGLVKYREGPPPYNVTVRGNRIDTVDSGIVTSYQVQDGGYAKSAPIRGCRIESNVVARASFEAYGLRNLGFSELVGNRATASRVKLRTFATEGLAGRGNDFDVGTEGKTAARPAAGWRADFSAGLPEGAEWWSANRKAGLCTIAPWVDPYDGRGMLKLHWDGVGGWMHVFFRTAKNPFPAMGRFAVRAVVRPTESADGAVRRLNLFLTDGRGERLYFDREARWTGTGRRTLTWIVDASDLRARTPNGRCASTLVGPVVDVGLNFVFFEAASACDLIVESLTAEELPPVDPSRLATFTYADFLDLANRQMLDGRSGTAERTVNPATGRTAIRCRPIRAPRAFGVNFSKGGSPVGVLSPKFPKFESADLEVAVTTDGRAPLDGLELAVVDTSSVVGTVKVPCAELATAGRHVVRTKLDRSTLAGDGASGRDRRHFALRGIAFSCAAGAKDTTAFVDAVALRTRSRAADVLRLELDTGADFNHSVPTGRTSVTARLVNPTTSPVRVRASFGLFDWRGDACGWQVARTLEIAGGTSAALDVPVPKDEGVFYVRGTLVGDDGETANPTVVERTFASFRPTGESPRLSGDGDFRFGTVAHLNPYFGCDAEMERCARTMAYVGLKVLRTNLFPWTEYERAQYDRMVALFLSHGIDIDFILPHSFSPETGEPHWEKLEKAYGDAFRRWKGKVAYWELLNEPDLSWGNPHPTSAADYAELARRTLRILRATDPSATYMSAGFCTFDEKILGRFQEEAMRTGKDVFDLHCFHGHGQFEHYRRLIEGKFLKLREDLGVKIPWYANETAVNASCGQSEKLQAETLYKKALYSWAKGAKGLTWYNLRGKGENPDEGEHGFGMMTFDMYPRAVYGAWNGLTRLYGGKRYVGALALGENAWGYVFAKGRENAACLWTAPGARRTMRFRTAAKRVEKTDLFGNRTTVRIRDGLFDLVIEEEPVNLVFETDSSEATGIRGLLADCP